MKVHAAETPDTPSQLLSAVVAEHTRLQTVRLFAKRNGAKDFDASVCTITLDSEDGEPVRHAHPPKDTASDIVSTLLTRARAHATETGDTAFQAQLFQCAGERGPAPRKPTLVAFSTSTTVSLEVDAEAELYIRMAEGLWKEHKTLLTATTALATAQVGIITALADAFSRITERERTIASSQQETELARIGAQIERERFAMLDKSLSPMLTALRRKLGVGDGKTTAPGTNGEDKTQPLARRARAFVQSLTGKQWDVARGKLTSRGTDALDRLRTATLDGEVMAAVADFVSESTESIMEVYAVLDGPQQTAMEELQTAVTDASDAAKADEQKALASGQPPA